MALQTRPAVMALFAAVAALLLSGARAAAPRDGSPPSPHVPLSGALAGQPNCTTDPAFDNCYDCVNGGCGWCATSAQCLYVNSTTPAYDPANASCPGYANGAAHFKSSPFWAVFTGQCNDCSRITHCGKCTAPVYGPDSGDIPCGWCASLRGGDGACVPLNGSVSALPPGFGFSCPNASANAADNWYRRLPYSTASANPPAATPSAYYCPVQSVNCSAYSSCGACHSDYRDGGPPYGACAWCVDAQGAGSCVANPKAAPNAPSTAHCTNGLITDAECPGNCTAITDCGTCNRQIGCGWCAVSGSTDARYEYEMGGVCLAGNDTGPYAITQQTCAVPDARYWRPSCSCNFASCDRCFAGSTTNTSATPSTNIPCVWCDSGDTTRGVCGMEGFCPTGTAETSVCHVLSTRENTTADIVIICLSGVACFAGLIWFHRYQSRQIAEPLQQPFPDATPQELQEKSVRKMIRWTQLKHPLLSIIYCPPTDGFGRKRRLFCCGISVGIQLSLPMIVLLSSMPTYGATLLAVGIALVLEEPIYRLVRATGRAAPDGGCCTAQCCRNCCLHCCLAVCFCQLMAGVLVLVVFIAIAAPHSSFSPGAIILSWLSAVFLAWVTAVPKQLALFVYAPAEATKEMNAYTRAYEPGWANWQPNAPLKADINSALSPSAAAAAAAPYGTLTGGGEQDMSYKPLPDAPALASPVSGADANTANVSAPNNV